MPDFANRVFREWTLADLIEDDRTLDLDGRIASIADHQCTPACAKRAVRAFGRLDIDFYLQRDTTGRTAINSIPPIRPDEPNTADRPERPSVSEIAWRLERAWKRVESTAGADGADDLDGLICATTSLLSPFEGIERCMRPSASGAFPFEWIACYDRRARSFRSFNASQLNANSLQYRGPSASISALFRIATLAADDFYTACAALLMGHGSNPGLVEGARMTACAKRSRDPWTFTYVTIPSMVDDRVYAEGAGCEELCRAEAVRALLVQPLAALYECEAMGARDDGPGATVLERRLRAAASRSAA